MCSLCHYCPLLLFLCGLWLVAWHSASSTVRTTCPISWFSHCCFNDSLFYMMSPPEYFFFTFLFYFNVFCVCKKPFESSLYFDYRMLSFVKVLKISVQETIILRGFYCRPIMKFLLHFRFIWIKYNIWQNLSHSCMLLTLHQLFIHAGTRRL